MTHEIKIESRYFGAVLAGDKTFEIRFNDRRYAVGDLVLMREFFRGKTADDSGLTGSWVQVRITYLTDFQQVDGWVVWGFKVLANG